MATHSSIPAWRILWTEEPGGLQSMGSKELDITEQTTDRQTDVRLLVQPGSSYLQTSVYDIIEEVKQPTH